MSRKELEEEFYMLQACFIAMDLFMAMLMFLIGRYFYNSKGKASNLLTGYNMRSENERRKFDEETMCRIYGKILMTMAVPFLLGLVIDLFKPGIGYGLAWFIWIVLFIMLCLKRSSMEK